MSVHYKFKSALDFDTVTFDGLHISVGDFKKAVCHQKRFGKSTDFDLQVTNAQTKEVYADDGTLIPKNTSLIVARVPLTAHQKRIWAREAAASSQALSKATADDGQDHGHSRLAKAVDLSRVDASEEDKIKAMMSQATSDYDPSNYLRIKGSGQIGEVPVHYRCHRCHQTGHWIKNCPLIKESGEQVAEIKKSTGIPRSFMVPVAGPLVPGAMITPHGGFAVPAIDHEAYKEQKKDRPAFGEDECPAEVKPELPEDLVCSICEDLLTDAVMIPCCGNSFCDECIRSALLESEDHECPDCKDKGVSPDTLLPNRFLRSAVAKFRNDTGYSKPLRGPLLVEPIMMPSPIKEEGTPKLESRTPSPSKSEELVREPTPDSRTDERSRSPVRRRYREDTPTHDEPQMPMNPLPPPSTHLLDRPPPSYHAPPPPGVDDHFVPSYPPPGPPGPRGPPPPMPFGQRPFRGQYYGRREPEFGYPYENRPFRPPRFERPYEDPLEAFNRILRAKDEQKRRRREFSPRPMMRRSRSPKGRSRSPKLRRSPPPLMSMKRKSPVKKYSRSRSRSPIQRRGRSRSFSISPSPTRHMRPLAVRRSRSPPPMHYLPEKYMDRPEKHMERMDKYMHRPDKFMERGGKYMERPEKYMDRPEKYMERTVERTDKFVDRSDKYMDRPEKYFDKPPEKYVDKYVTDKYVERHEKYVERPEKFVDRSEKFVERSEKFVERGEKFVERSEKHSRSRVEEHKPSKHREKERAAPREVEERESHREAESSERLHREPEKASVEKVESPIKNVEDFRTLINIKKAKHDGSTKKSSPEPEEKVKEVKTKEKKKRRESTGSKKKKHKEKDKEKKKKTKTPKVAKEEEDEKQQGEAPDTTTAEEEPKEEAAEQAKEAEVEAPTVEEKLEEPVKPEILPEPSKWEKSDEEAETSREEPAKNTEEEKSVTVEVLKRAENAIFKKAINAIRPERKVYLDPKTTEDIQINVTVEEVVPKKAEKRKSTEEPEIETVKKKKHKKEKKKKTKKKSSSSSSGSSSDSEVQKKKKKKKKNKKAKKKKHHSTEDSDSSSEEEKKSKKKKKKKHKK